MHFYVAKDRHYNFAYVLPWIEFARSKNSSEWNIEEELIDLQPWKYIDLLKLEQPHSIS